MTRLLFLTLAFAVACGTDDGKGKPGADAGMACDIDPKFAALQAKIFNTPTCNAPNICHGANAAGPAKGNLLLAADNAVSFAEWQKNTDDATAKVSWPKRVVANNLDMSYLWQKVTRDDVPGGRMPIGASLNQCQLDAIKGWIMNGAALN